MWMQIGEIDLMSIYRCCNFMLNWYSLVEFLSEFTSSLHCTQYNFVLFFLELLYWIILIVCCYPAFYFIFASYYSGIKSNSSKNLWSVINQICLIRYTFEYDYIELEDKSWDLSLKNWRRYCVIWRE